LIFDEIQTGFGRTGTFWALEQFGFAPDILLSAKGMGGGMPIGAFMAPQKIMGVLKDNPILGHITTFGGHPVSCVASLATLQIIQEEINYMDLLQKSERIKSIFLKHPLVKSIRGRGFMLAAEFENFEILKKTIDGFIENGLITDWFLYCDNAMRISPPLNISKTELADVIHFGDCDTWYKVKVSFVSYDADTEKEKRQASNVLVNAPDIIEAVKRTNDSFKDSISAFEVLAAAISPIVEIYAYDDSESDLPKPIGEIIQDNKAGIYSAPSLDEDEDFVDEETGPEIVDEYGSAEEEEETDEEEL
jgi:hypothetical protein